MAKGRLTRYQKLVSGITPHYTNVVVQPRGFPIFSDPLLKGQVRFARKTGADFALINPDNEIKLATAATRRNRNLSLSSPNRWVEIGSILSLGPGEEFVRVQDFNFTPSVNTITLTKPISGNFPNSTEVHLYATPIQLTQNIEENVKNFVVRSRYHILAGDNLVVEATPGLITSLIELRVTRARLLDIVSGSNPFNQFFEIELETPVGLNLDTQSDMYLKAQPSYLSNQVFVPQVPNQPDDIGPFLLDYVSGVLFERPKVREQLSVTVFDKLGNSIVDDSGFPLKVSKNFPISIMPLMADSILLWQVADGAVTFSKRGNTQEITAVAVCDNDGKFQTTQELIPFIDPGTEWSIPAVATTPCVVKVTFFPNEPREFTLSSGIPKQLLIGTKDTDMPIERIEIIVIGNSDTEVQFGNWIPVKSQAFSIIYGITADVFGEAQWQATNLFQKPYFLNFAMGLKGRFDSNRTPNRFDGGVLFL